MPERLDRGALNIIGRTVWQRSLEEVPKPGYLLVVNVLNMRAKQNLDPMAAVFSHFHKFALGITESKL